MASFTVNGRLAALCEMAGTFAEKILLGDGPQACITAHMFGEDAEGKISVYTLAVPGELIDQYREHIFSTEMPKHERMVFMCEAWLVRARELPSAGEGLSDHPEREEVVVFDGRDNAGKLVKGSRALVRSERPYLLPMMWADPGVSVYLPSTTDTRE